jgi:hypothetical protein
MYFINCNTCDLIENNAIVYNDNAVVYNTIMCFVKYFNLKISICG